MSAEVLLVCARRARSDGEKARLRRLLEAKADWSGFVRTAVDEGVVQMAYLALKEHADLVPGEVIENLRRYYYLSAARYLRLRGALRPVVEDLSRRGFRFAFTKGIRLAEPVYGDFALRSFTDIDLMVHPGDGAGVEAALAGLGFERDAEEGEKGEPWGETRELMLRTYSPFFRKGDLLVEVHYDALGLQIPLVAGEEIWAGAGQVDLGGTSLPVLSLEHELCHLCLHVMQHSYARLIWLTDIAEVAGRPGFDWKRLASICRREGIGAPVYHGLFLADRLWPGAAPGDALDGLRPGPFQRALCGLFWPAEKVRARGKPVFFPYFMPSFFALIRRGDPGFFVRMVGRTVFPPRAWVARYYGFEGGALRGTLQLAGHYLWRVQRPFALVARRLLKLG